MMPHRPAADGAITRRLVLAGGAAAGIPSPAIAQAATTWWEEYRARYVNADGRVVDDVHMGGTHSEGQAWAMLLAARAGDEAGFDLIRDWTLRHLACRGDALLAWLHQPRLGVVDRNNATDADLYHAFALLEADRAWPWKRLGPEARRVAGDCLRLLLRQAGGMWLLLPGATGFEGWRHLDLNPSYVLPHIFRRLEAATGDARWGALARDGARLLESALFSRWRLPPDWVRLNLLTGGLSPVPGRPFRFGYDALRVPMNLAWAGADDHAALRAVAAFWAREFPPPPAWVALDDGRFAHFRGDMAHVAVQALVAGSGRAALLGAGAQAATRYYGATLHALCGEIARERGREEHRT